MARVVSLDIGTYAVRAVELTVGGGEPVLERFAQVVLPPGAVDRGEVVDAAAVATAVRRLWSEGGLRGRRVVIGVANQRVIVRQADFPAMSEEDFQAALQFEAQELIPIPVEEAVLDFQIVEESVATEGEPRMRVLLAAAQREMVQAHVAAVEAADLTPTAVDVVPFALVRALALSAEGTVDDRAAEAVVCIGGGVTNVVVHEGGVPRFVRILLVGGNDITAAVSQELDVDADEAEDLKRRADPASDDERVARAGEVVADRLAPLVEEIRGSLDYYRSQPEAVPITRVLLTGGASRSVGLVERLAGQLDGVVEQARPLAGVRIGAVNLSEAELVQLEALLAVPIGLALAGDVQRGVRRISLLPREMAVVRAQRRQTMLAAAAVAALFVLLMLIWAARSAQEANERDRAREAERRAAQLRQERAQLGDTTTIESELAQRQAQARAVLADDVAWTRLFNEVATVIPNDVWLTSFNGTKGNPGSITVQANGFDQTSTARWLLRVGELKSLSGVWVPNSAKQGEGPAALVSFQSQANLTPQAVSDRAQRFAGGGP
ncbi:MAG: type IV pilus assembly protein PilM [Actinomycetota bacterium]|nr:type IV pilus assembly protein PilM [Actinomycetota bacterium]